MNRIRYIPAVVVLTLALLAPRAAHAICLPPSSMNATDGTVCGAVTVTWTPGILGDSFRIYRGPDNVFANAVQIGTSTGSTFNDTSAQPGVTYTYFVKMFNASCPSGSIPNLDTGSSGSPAAPSGVTASDSTSCSYIRVNWNLVANATGYVVIRSETPDPTQGINLIQVGSVFDTYADPTAQPNHPYWYFVRALEGSCGSTLQAGDVGTRKLQFLPDLTLDTGFGPAPSEFLITPGHYGFRFGTAVANVGATPLYIVPSKIYPDGTRDFVERTVTCDGHVVFKPLGRYGVPTPSDVATFPHFLRAYLRRRLANGDPGEAVAMVDLPATCIHDVASFDSAIPGWSATPAFTGCQGTVRGISIGWELQYPYAQLGQTMSLDCIANGTYWFELVVDPDNLIQELDETNNVSRQLVTLDLLTPPAYPPCQAPAITARILGPDSLQVAAGALSDTIKATAWCAGATEPGGPVTLINGFAEIGYIPTVAGKSVQGDSWIWKPATWLRQDGAEDVYGAQLTIPAPGEYAVAFKFIDLAASPILADLDGTQNGFSMDTTVVLRQFTTTAVGDGPGAPGGALAFSFGVLSNPARHATRFTLELPEVTSARIAIYDARGRRVRAIDAGTLAAGAQTIDWDDRGDDGRAAHAGVYFARLETGDGKGATAKWALTP